MKYRNRYASLYLSKGSETRGWTFKLDGDGRPFVATGQTGGMAVRTAARAALAGTRSKAAVGGTQGMKKILGNVGVFLAVEHPVLPNRAVLLCRTTLPALVPMARNMQGERWLDACMENFVDMLLQAEEDELRRLVVFGVAEQGSIIENVEKNIQLIFEGEREVTPEVFAKKMGEVVRQYVYGAARSFLIAALGAYGKGETWLASDFYLAESGFTGGDFPETTDISSGVRHLFSSLKNGGMTLGWLIAKGFDRVKTAYSTNSLSLRFTPNSREEAAVTAALGESSVEGFRHALGNKGYQMVFYDMREGSVFASDKEMFKALQKGEEPSLSCRYSPDADWRSVKDITHSECFDPGRFGELVKKLRDVPQNTEVVQNI